MAQVTTGLRRVLSSPRVYDLWGHLIGGAAAYADLVQNYVKPRPGDTILDIGCGTGVLVPFLGDVTYVGFDANPDYIERARRAHGHRARFECARVGEDTFTGELQFDVVVAIGVLHHLDDEDGIELFRSGRRALRPGGRLISCDPGLFTGQSPIARWLIHRDRGQNVRTADGYRRLATQVFPPPIHTHVRHDMLRIPYTHAIVECANEPS